MAEANDASAVCVLSARGLDRILKEGGSQAWVLDAKRARTRKYVVVVQNHGFAEGGDDWGEVSAPHHTAFVVGRLKNVVPSGKGGNGNRWMLQFSEYAEIDVADAWPGYRNPVSYTDLESMGINLESLQFKPLPSKEAATPVVTQNLTIAEAKEGLARTFGVSPSDVQITIRG